MPEEMKEALRRALSSLPPEAMEALKQAAEESVYESGDPIMVAMLESCKTADSIVGKMKRIIPDAHMITDRDDGEKIAQDALEYLKLVEVGIDNYLDQRTREYGEVSDNG